jgi:hypothetical protein
VAIRALRMPLLTVVAVLAPLTVGASIGLGRGPRGLRLADIMAALPLEPRDSAVL